MHYSHTETMPQFCVNITNYESTPGANEHRFNMITSWRAVRKYKGIKKRVYFAVQDPRVPILPSALWDHAVWPDPGAEDRPAQVLPAHRIGVPDHPEFGSRSASQRRLEEATALPVPERHRGLLFSTAGREHLISCNQWGTRRLKRWTVCDMMVLISKLLFKGLLWTNSQSQIITTSHPPDKWPGLVQ